ncbi:methylaspartate ammonia-lyase [Specibacter cremeus]|uniref:methylaspartate ammonia-lyase n=1 Tax=Specibacter cremeus TaxID=1629051 RepID=UPI000F776B3A|nr:methylaspartate ammonia-lyase [Specibacter cremeus]
MRIKRVLASKGLGGYYFDDLHAIKAGAKKDGFFYLGEPQVPGQYKVRQPGESISIILVLESGEVAFGDAVAIQYSGVVGRDPVLSADTFAPHVEKYIAPWLVGRELTSLREMCGELEALQGQDGPLHTGLRYGTSQAILQALAMTQRRTMAEVVADEYGTTVSEQHIPVLAQSGDDRHSGADKMILKRVPAITQGLFNHVDKIGESGERLLEYVEWLRTRVETFGDAGYAPVFHLDVYGMPGEIFNNDPVRTAEYLSTLGCAAKPFQLRIEAPVDGGSRDRTMDLMIAVRKTLAEIGSDVQICADDWCNTLADIKIFARSGAADMIQIKAPDLGSITNSIEAVQFCQGSGVQAFLGGTCNGTDQSSRVTVHAAMGARADLIYNKPGMGVDEGLMIVTNEMSRILALTGSGS